LKTTGLFEISCDGIACTLTEYLGLHI